MLLNQTFNSKVKYYTDKYGTSFDGDILMGSKSHKQVLTNTTHDFILLGTFPVRAQLVKYFDDQTIKNYAKNITAMSELTKYIIMTTQRAQYDYGSACGTRSGQSIEEPLTQFSLNAIHLASDEQGFAEQKKSLERINRDHIAFKEPELCDTEPNTFIKLNNIQSSDVSPEQLISQLEAIKCSDIISEIVIMLEAPHPDKQRRNILHRYNNDLSKTVMLCWQIKFNKSKMFTKNITCKEIIDKIQLQNVVEYETVLYSGIIEPEQYCKFYIPTNTVQTQKMMDDITNKITETSI